MKECHTSSVTLLQRPFFLLVMLLSAASCCFCIRRILVFSFWFGRMQPCLESPAYTSDVAHCSQRNSSVSQDRGGQVRAYWYSHPHAPYDLPLFWDIFLLTERNQPIFCPNEWNQSWKPFHNMRARSQIRIDAHENTVTRLQWCFCSPGSCVRKEPFLVGSFCISLYNRRLQSSNFHSEVRSALMLK